MQEKDNKQRGATPEPADSGRNTQQHEHTTKEGDYRNAETRAGNASYFNDDYEVGQENDIAKEEAKTEEQVRKD
jgi:hypothetical protein